MLISETSFSQAVQRFREFLAENKLPTEINWLFCEDVFSRNTDLFETDFWLKLPIPSENKRLTENQYNIGQKKGFGIGLVAFAVCEGKSCCSLLIPKDEEDSEFLFMSPKYLKFSFLQEMPTVRIVKNSLHWKIFKLMPFKFKRGNFYVYLESKKDLRQNFDL